MSRDHRRKSCLTIYFLCVVFVSPAHWGAAFQSPSPVAERAHKILESRCAECHHEGGIGAAQLKIERFSDLIASGFVIAKDENSELLKQVEQGLMPLGKPKICPAEIGKPKLCAAEVAALKDWILQGALSWETPSREAARTFVSEAQIIQLIQTDLKKQNERSLPYLRYYSIVHLYNAGVPDEDLEQYRIGLSKLVNSLSRMPKIVRPLPVNAERTLLRIDLRDFKWDDAIWKTILRAYPYGVRSSASDDIQRMTGADVPYVRADWFVFQASTIPLYHNILRLPSTVKELEVENGVDVERDFSEEHNFARAGFSVSGVSNNNRIIERHDSINGAYWRSYDFKNNEGDSNISKNPLTFKAAGGEIIFNLPNGLQAYMLADAEGNRLDKAADPKIVRDREGGIDVEVTNGRSCMGCHVKGMRNKNDVVRSSVLSAPSFPNREKVLAVYPEQTELNELFDTDDLRFKKAVVAAGGQITAADPINQLSKKYHEPLSLDLAASELGFQASAFKQKIREDRTLGNLGFGQLLEPGGAYQRDAWEGNFSELARELGLGNPADHVLIRDSGQAPPAAPTYVAKVEPPRRPEPRVVPKPEFLVKLVGGPIHNSAVGGFFGAGDQTITIDSDPEKREKASTRSTFDFDYDLTNGNHTFTYTLNMRFEKTRVNDSCSVVFAVDARSTFSLEVTIEKSGRIKCSLNKQ